MNNITENIKFNDQGLIPAIAQQYDSGEILMMAWMNKEAIEQTIQTNIVHYFSRSRNKLWRKGESSGQTQELKEILLDCDLDTILLKINQEGVACHTGRRSCFFNTIDKNEIKIISDILVKPSDLYQK